MIGDADDGCAGFDFGVQSSYEFFTVVKVPKSYKSWLHVGSTIVGRLLRPLHCSLS